MRILSTLLLHGRSQARRSRGHRLRPDLEPSNKLNPLTVTVSEAESFFDGLNVRLAQLAAAYLSPGAVVLYTGSNGGLFTRDLLSARKDIQTVALFEAVENLLNSRDVLSTYEQKFDIRYLNCALRNSTGQLVLYLPPDGNLSWITSGADYANGLATVSVPIEDTAKYMVRFNSNFVIIDVEGAEAPILRQVLANVSRSEFPLILVELGWGRCSAKWPEELEIRAGFISEGYSLFKVGLGAKSVEVVRLADVEEFLKTSDLVPLREAGRDVLSSVYSGDQDAPRLFRLLPSPLH